MKSEYSIILQTIIDETKLKKQQLPTLMKEIKNEYKLQLGVNIKNNTAESYANQLFKIKNTLKEIDKISLNNQVLAWRKANSAVEREYGATLDSLLAKLSAVDNQAGFSKLEKEFGNLQLEAHALGLTGKSTMDILGAGAKKLIEWGLSSDVVTGVINSFKIMASSVIEVDSAMSKLRKVTDETDLKYKDFLDNANHKAQELGRSVSSLIGQTSNWSKLGYGMNDASKLAEVSSIYSNLGEIDDDQAVSDLVTAMKAFNITASDSINIVDSFTKLGDKFDVTAGSLGDGLRNSASALSLGGTDINKSLALLTGGAEITQNAAELGNALKVGQLRIMGMKSALEELGEESEGLESVNKIQSQILNLTNGQVNIMSKADPSKIKDYYDILESVSKVYNSLKQTEQEDLLETLFGKQRGIQGSAVIQAFQSGQVQKALEVSLNSSGSAYEEQSRWMDSLEAKTQQYGVSLQSLSQTVLSSNFLKILIESGTTLNNVLDGTVQKFGLVSTLLGSAGIAAFVKNYG
ncbi:phage tail tape measure protein [Lacrimispora brassicae]